MIVTGVLAVPLAGTDRVPLVGLAVTPLEAEAVQLTVCALLVREVSDSVAVAVAPGCRYSVAGLADAVSANTGP